jgi:hypothetical protein
LNTWKERVLTGAAVLFGAMWITSAWLKLHRPLGAIELVAHVTPDGMSSKAAVAAVVGAEATLGALMCLRAIRGFVPSLAALVLLSGVLVLVWQRGEGTLVPCGCFGDLFGTTALEGLVRNAVLVAAHVALILWGRAKGAT